MPGEKHLERNVDIDTMISSNFGIIRVQSDVVPMRNYNARKAIVYL